MSTPHNHADLTTHFLEFLASEGVVRDPNSNQLTKGTLPAVFAHYLRDVVGAPDEAVAVIGPTVRQDPTHSNPELTLLVVVRSEPWRLDRLEQLAQDVTRALHHEKAFALTATRGLAYCELALTGQPVQDDNRRWVRVDTYVARARVPNS